MWEREERTEEGSTELQARQTAYSQHIMAIIRQRREVDWEGLEGGTQRGGGSQEVAGGCSTTTTKLEDENKCVMAAWVHESSLLMECERKGRELLSRILEGLQSG